MRFIDLFAGLGGFHQALAGLGHECVFASEINDSLAGVYRANFGIKPHGDIRTAVDSVPAHDILCAGFPCQPFSKAGEQKGFACPQWGDLFEYVLDILRTHQTPYFVIENVPNLVQHNKGATWSNICKSLISEGYDINYTILSPHMFGIPQLRNRAIIVGSRSGLSRFTWPVPTHSASDADVRSILDQNPTEAKPLPKELISYITAWQALLDALPEEQRMPSFPLWAMEFGATYPIGDDVHLRANLLEQAPMRGTLGLVVDPALPLDAQLPPYARGDRATFPKWKIRYIRQNREFYATNRAAIDRWLPSIRDFAPSYQKLEWNWQGGPRDLWQAMLQFRASGIRARRPGCAPSLVALNTSQVPVIAWERRYMTPRECARLQSMGDLKTLPAQPQATFKALGNAVNVTVMEKVAAQLLPNEG